MSTASKTSKSSLVNSLAKRYDPKALQNQGPIASQKTSQTNPVSKDIKSAVNITTMDIKLDSLCQKIDSLLMEQDNVLKKLENISQDVFGIEKDLETIKSDNTKTEQVTEKLQDKENMLEMKELFSEMVSNLSSINKYAEQQAKRLDGVEQILLGTQSVVRFVMEEIRLPAIFDFLQNRPNTVKPPNDNINEKAVKKSQKEKGSRKGEKCVKDRNSSKKSKKNLQSKKKYKVTKNQKANQKKTLYLSCKGTASLKQEPPDTERSVQRTQSCTQKEKVQKLNKENTEKTTVILVESISTESQAEEISNLKRCISIDIPISQNRTPIEGDAPIIFSEESDRQSTPINADNFQSSTGVSNEDEGTEECFSKIQQCTEEKELSISVSEDEETVNNEDGKEDKKDDKRNDEVQDEKDSTENEISEEETEPLVVTEEDSELSENEGQAISASDKPQEKTQVPKTEVGEISTACTDSSHSDTENTVLKLAKEDNEVSGDLIQNGENGYHEHSYSSKRVADEDQVKDDNKKSRVDTQATGEIISAKSAEETIVSLVISTEEPQTTDSTQDCTEQPSLKEETRFVLDAAPPPPAPFDHRIVSAKHAQINSFYSVEKTEVLGTGRFGQVHSCVEKSSGLRLAAKVIKVRGHKEKEEVKNEIQVMNQLNHTNLIQLYDAFESRNDIVLVMEFVEGGELFDRIIDENCNLSEVDTILYIKQICEGIQYMHQMYIIHLDLKPENIMCVSRAANQIKIIDFGLARRYKPREKLKVHFGTPEFLAPEVVNYDFVSFPTDMWSVGVIAYMLLSGLSPFLGEDDNETLNNILACQWDFEGEEFNNISEDAKDFIIKLLVKEKCWRMSATESLKHSWLSDPKLHFKISQKVETDSLPEASVGQ